MTIIRPNLRGIFILAVLAFCAVMAIGEVALGTTTTECKEYPPQPCNTINPPPTSPTTSNPESPTTTSTNTPSTTSEPSSSGSTAPTTSPVPTQGTAPVPSTTPSSNGDLANTGTETTALIIIGLWALAMGLMLRFLSNRDKRDR